MILSRLTINDFGVFHGSQSFDLSPKKSRPIVLFGGKNGAGKTSILDAIRLCFYGSAALGIRSKDEYLAYLGTKIHLNPTALIQAQYASIAVDFEYGDMRTLHAYSVTRAWERKSSNKIFETLTVLRDGNALDEVTAEHWQDFVRDLIPLGLSQLFFFDGEKIQDLAEDTTDQLTLAQAIKSLLGLDIVEGLQADLGVYLSRLSRPLRQGVGTPLAELEIKRADLQTQQKTAQAERAIAQNRIAELRAEIRAIEQHIAGEGGGLARNREKLILEEAGYRARIDAHEKAIRELAAGLMPFALAPELCLELRRELLSEERELQQRNARQVLEDTKARVARELKTSSVWDEIHLSATLRKKAVETLASAIGKHFESKSDQSGVAPVHNLSLSQHTQLLSWLDQTTANVAAILSVAAAELERCHHGLRRVKEDLRKIPADDILRPLLEQLHRSHEQLGEASRQALKTDEHIASIEAQLCDQDRQYKVAVERLVGEAGLNSKIQLIPRIHSALDEYKNALLLERVDKLQRAVTECFASLSRKKDSVRKVSIDPKKFSITLYDRANNPLNKTQLSAGEKQIYAISMLWGLAKTSGRPLPVIIDTPLARLDSDHRNLLATNYFPVASHQVIVLSTDTEVDRTYFDALKPSVAHSYHLTFDENLGGTMSRKGYFWEDENEANKTEVNKGRIQSAAVSSR